MPERDFPAIFAPIASYYHLISIKHHFITHIVWSERLGSKLEICFKIIENKRTKKNKQDPIITAISHISVLAVDTLRPIGLHKTKLESVAGLLKYSYSVTCSPHVPMSSVKLISPGLGFTQGRKASDLPHQTLQAYTQYLIACSFESGIGQC